MALVQEEGEPADSLKEMADNNVTILIMIRIMMWKIMMKTMMRIMMMIFVVNTVRMKTGTMMTMKCVVNTMMTSKENMTMIMTMMKKTSMTTIYMPKMKTTGMMMIVTGMKIGMREILKHVADQEAAEDTVDGSEILRDILRQHAEIDQVEEVLHPEETQAAMDHLAVDQIVKIPAEDHHLPHGEAIVQPLTGEDRIEEDHLHAMEILHIMIMIILPLHKAEEDHLQAGVEIILLQVVAEVLLQAEVEAHLPHQIVAEEILHRIEVEVLPEEEDLLQVAVGHPTAHLLLHALEPAEDQAAVVEVLPEQEKEAQAEQVHVVGVAQEDVNLIHPLHLLPVNLHLLVVVEKNLPAAADN